MSLSIFPFSSFPSTTDLGIQKNYQWCRGQRALVQPLSGFLSVSSTLSSQQYMLLLTQHHCLVLSPVYSVIQLSIWRDISSFCLWQSLTLPCFKWLCEFSDTLWMVLLHGWVWLFFHGYTGIGDSGKEEATKAKCRSWPTTAKVHVPRLRLTAPTVIPVASPIPSFQIPLFVRK